MRALVLVLTLAACAATPGFERSGEAELSRELAGRVAGPAQACIQQVQGEALRALDGRTLIYRRTDTVWVNRLERDCSGVGPHSTLIVESFADRYCRGDRLRGVETGARVPGPTCLLSEFVPYRRPS